MSSVTEPVREPGDTAGKPGQPPPRRSSRTKPIIAGILLVAGFAALLAMALRPRQQRERDINEAARRAGQAPVVLVAKAALLPARGDLVLPGSMQAITETPIFARSEGYVRQRLVDIGDAVRKGQLLAVIEAPELDKQVQQAQATLARAESATEQSKASLSQTETQLKLAEVTAQRWNTLFNKRVVSRQEVDEKQAAFEARRADFAAARANVSAAESAVAAYRADLQRLMDLKGFQELRAPFGGIITERNTEVGALIRGGASEGRELFRLAQNDTLRITVNVPQVNVPAIRVGLAAFVTVAERPDRTFAGKVVRTANALDPATRTLLAEIHVLNAERLLLPGMYARVQLRDSRIAPAVTIPGDTLVVRSDGPQVALVLDGGRIQYQKIALGRDYGDRIEVTAGLRGGESIVINPSDAIREGAVVEARSAEEKAPDSRQSK